MVLDSSASSNTPSSASVFLAVTVFHRVLASCGRCGFCADCLSRTATALRLSFGVTSGCPDSFPVSWLRQDSIPASCGRCGFCADCLARTATAFTLSFGVTSGCPDSFPVSWLRQDGVPTSCGKCGFCAESVVSVRIASPCHG